MRVDDLTEIILDNAGYLRKGRIRLERASAGFTAGYCLLACALPELLKGVPLLHPKEKEYLDSLRFVKRQASFLLGRITAKIALAEQHPVWPLNSILVDSGVFQFPVVRHPGLQNVQASISHSGDFGITLAFPEEHPMAVDLESVKEKNPEAMKSQMTLSEQQLLEQLPLPAPVGYTLLWTMKEGLSKALRTGMTMDFNLLEINALQAEGEIYRGTFRNSIQYQALSFPGKNYVVSVILPRKTTPGLSAFWEDCKVLDQASSLH